MRPTTHESPTPERRLPKSFRLLREATLLADGCAREMLANLDAPDLAATGDRIDRLEEERRALAAETEDHLRGALLSPIDPADLHGLSASIGILTHRAARALYFFSLLGSTPAPPALRVLTRLLSRASADALHVVDALLSMRSREVAAGVHGIRRLRDDVRVELGGIVAATSSTEDHQMVLWRTVGEAIDGAAAQTLTVAEVCLRIATKHD